MAIKKLIPLKKEQNLNPGHKTDDVIQMINF